MRQVSEHKYYLIFILCIFSFLTLRTVQAADKENDADALHGAVATKAVFDVRVTKPEKLGFFLQVIGQTHDDLVRQGQVPEFVVAFRGPAVRFITSENWSFSVEDQQYIEKSAVAIAELKDRGVKFEACSIAAGLFRVDRETYLPAIKPVGNSFVSLIGYQSKGYGLVPVN